LLASSSSGHLDRAELLAKYRSAHVVVVPTRNDFCEGYAQVVAEAVLLGRPVVTNKVVPALEDLGEVIEKANPDDVGSLVQYLKTLAFDRNVFEKKRQACVKLRGVILNADLSLYAQLMKNKDLIPPLNGA
jgi:glycogen(starch) synthase